VSGDDDRPRRSWREIDQMRSGARGSRNEQRPRGKAAEAEARKATRAALSEADELFASPRAEEAARELREAHGGGDFEAACQKYRSELGIPEDLSLLSLLLDASDPQLLADALEALLERAQAGEVEVSAGLRTQLRGLSEHTDDNVAGAAEDLLELA
jgi:hypothetical protein